MEGCLPVGPDGDLPIGPGGGALGQPGLGGRGLAYGVQEIVWWPHISLGTLWWPWYLLEWWFNFFCSKSFDSIFFSFSLQIFISSRIDASLTLLHDSLGLMFTTFWSSGMTLPSGIFLKKSSISMVINLIFSISLSKTSVANSSTYITLVPIGT